MNFVMAGAEKNVSAIYLRCPCNVRSLGLKRAVVGAQTCSRWGSNVQSLELDRAVDSLPSYYSMPGHCTHDLYEAVQAFQEV